MRVFATHLVIGSQEREIQQRHTPEERARQTGEIRWIEVARFEPLLPNGEVFAREHFNNRGRIGSRA